VAGLVVSGTERRTAESWFGVPNIGSSHGFVRTEINL
jgi:trehalose-6-phosphatase